jgi:hypothetical protein
VTHRLRACAEDRIRGLKDTGATNLPLHAFDKNQIWLELAQLAAELLAWTQLLAWHDQPARVWEPKRLRLRLLAVAGRVIPPVDAGSFDSPGDGPGPTSWSAATEDSPRSPEPSPTAHRTRTGEPATQRRRPTTPISPAARFAPLNPPRNNQTKDRG